MLTMAKAHLIIEAAIEKAKEILPFRHCCDDDLHVGFFYSSGIGSEELARDPDGSDGR